MQRVPNSFASMLYDKPAHNEHELPAVVSCVSGNMNSLGYWCFIFDWSDDHLRGDTVYKANKSTRSRICYLRLVSMRDCDSGSQAT